MDSEFLALAPLYYIVFLFSTTCHEAAHALVAKLGGDLTAFYTGQVSLNPIPHMRREPFGMVVFPLLSMLMSGGMFGWASAPYDPVWQRRYPKRAGWMSLAGPAANFTLVLIAAAGIHLCVRFGLVSRVEPGVAAEGLLQVLVILLSLNLLLGTFNLLPIPPLDGYSVLGLFTSDAFAVRMQEWRNNMRAFSLLGIVVSWQVFGNIYPAVQSVAMRLLAL